MASPQHLVIIGNGIAGVTTARHVRKRSDCKITILSEESKYFFSRTALMYVYMGHMAFQHTQPYENGFWKKNKINLVQSRVNQVDGEKKQIQLANGTQMPYDQLVLAVGSKPNKFGWPGQDLVGVSGLYSKQDLEYVEAHTKGVSQAVIVGGGLIGVEMAEMLYSRKIAVSFLVREENFWGNVLPEEEAKMVNREIRNHHIDLRLQTELKEILADEAGRVRRVIAHQGDEIPCQFVGLTAGVSPNIAWLKGQGLETNRGILVDEYLQTNLPDVYAIGDCAELRNPTKGRKALEQVWYTGRMMGETLARTLTGAATAYCPGIWFNSAKFFNIEYQTYGQVSAQLPQGEETFYWESRDGKKSFRLVFDEKTKAVRGVNVFGIRMRHEVWNDWIQSQETVDFVIANLEKANFDPEFFKRHESAIRQAFNESFSYMQAG